jgi:hypothetical protein
LLAFISPVLLLQIRISIASFHDTKLRTRQFSNCKRLERLKVNSTEGVYTALVALVSLLTFSTVISFMTSLIGTLQHKRMEEQLG